MLGWAGPEGMLPLLGASLLVSKTRRINWFCYGWPVMRMSVRAMVIVRVVMSSALSLTRSIQILLRVGKGVMYYVLLAASQYSELMWNP
jgi:hypothetical protein